MYRKRKLGTSEGVFHPMILAMYERRVQVRTAPIGIVGSGMLWKCSGDALEMFRRGSEVTWEMLRRCSNRNLSGAIGSLLLSVLNCLKGLIGSLLGLQSDLSVTQGQYACLSCRRSGFKSWQFQQFCRDFFLQVHFHDKTF